MSWLTNDFVQERLWKATAAAQISRRAAYNSREFDPELVLFVLGARTNQVE
ncbi:hypothetical protein HanPI659440_Chr01g0018531 [Helianthus annuus]|nr:hypothetical protein HanHA300_Chr17g0672741 [Helianthus annuus]KAJ0634069.1 hypothetical protein HanLR1_Chr17g0684001 [Helianthus annuus]KAJ0809719.1 hypothetical protein HanPI659440_Chr01g0018531 [Helianthus annuus]